MDKFILISITAIIAIVGVSYIVGHLIIRRRYYKITEELISFNTQLEITDTHKFESGEIAVHSWLENENSAERVKN